jgi:hypothetical protein
MRLSSASSHSYSAGSSASHGVARPSRKAASSSHQRFGGGEDSAKCHTSTFVPLVIEPSGLFTPLGIARIIAVDSGISQHSAPGPPRSPPRWDSPERDPRLCTSITPCPRAAGPPTGRSPLPAREMIASSKTQKAAASRLRKRAALCIFIFKDTPAAWGTNFSAGVQSGDSSPSADASAFEEVSSRAEAHFAEAGHSFRILPRARFPRATSVLERRIQDSNIARYGRVNVASCLR